MLSAHRSIDPDASQKAPLAVIYSQFDLKMMGYKAHQAVRQGSNAISELPGSRRSYVRNTLPHEHTRIVSNERPPVERFPPALLLLLPLAISTSAYGQHSLAMHDHSAVGGPSDCVPGRFDLPIQLYPQAESGNLFTMSTRQTPKLSSTSTRA
ncbi:hypothetical protein [Granulicella sp. dw_53]|uniref:hypothetical protein n=1 Tax=Granulicella sp. dw_53 TaxID=2719792 RepID=UPI001BD5A9F4|nr:hypothetical protein [Granulicella sp. dw_53]